MNSPAHPSTRLPPLRSGRAAVRAWLILLVLLALPSLLCAQNDTEKSGEGEQSKSEPSEETVDQAKDPRANDELRLSDEAIGLQYDKIPTRPAPVIELGEPFLGTGQVSEPFESPTGAIWQPQFIVFGTARSGFNYWDVNGTNRGGGREIEWANHLEAYGELRLTPTERFLLGFSPFSRDGTFSGYRYESEARGLERNEWYDTFNAEPIAAFFEGDLGELFPGLDIQEDDALDIGFTIGRNLVGPEFQDGLLINDRLDMIGITRNTLKAPGIANLRITGLWAWGDVHRANGREDSTADLFALLTAADINWDGHHQTSLEADVAWVSSRHPTSSALFAAASAVQRVGSVSTTFRWAGSWPFDQESDEVRQGHLLLTELSIRPGSTNDIIYFGGYLGIEEYTQAARDPSFNTPIGNTGILFQATGLGQIPPALGDRPRRQIAGALGYQWFFFDDRHQITFEVAGVADPNRWSTHDGGIGLRYQFASWNRFVLRTDGFVIWPGRGTPVTGARAEVVIKF